MGKTYIETMREVDIPVGGPVRVGGTLSVPENAAGLILFAHGSGSSRFSPRNRYVAGMLQETGLGTLLIDLLTGEEERIDMVTAEMRFDIGLLAERVMAAARWVLDDEATRDLHIGCFGSSTGAAAALVAAAEMGDAIKAVVSRGGRPDLAMDCLPRVKAPTLLIVGENDQQVIAMNRSAYELLRVEKQLLIVPEATHLFEESGALERVASETARWFHRYL
jgi:putative phosphoribosyl transferase